MSFDLFTCCTGADDAKYIHPCACPTTSLQFQAEHIDGVLCGRNEFYNAANNVYHSSPPKRYLTKTNTYNQTITCSNWCPTTVFSRSVYSNSTISYTFDSNGNCINPPFTILEVYSNLSRDDCDGAETTRYDPHDELGDNFAQSTTFSSTSFNSPYNCTFGVTGSNVGTITTTLSNEDTEQAVIARKTPINISENSSLYSTRTTGYTFVYRTCAYTINCSNLIVGFDYKVTPTIRKRTAIHGAFDRINYGTFEDVEVTPYTFTATATTETIDDNGNPIDVDLVQGYQYEVTGATIEKV